MTFTGGQGHETQLASARSGWSQLGWAELGLDSGSGVHVPGTSSHLGVLLMVSGGIKPDGWSLPIALEPSNRRKPLSLPPTFHEPTPIYGQGQGEGKLSRHQPRGAPPLPVLQARPVSRLLHQPARAAQAKSSASLAFSRPDFCPSHAAASRASLPVAQTPSSTCCPGDNSHCSVPVHCLTDAWRKDPGNFPRRVRQGDKLGGHSTLLQPPTAALKHVCVTGRTQALGSERLRLK